MISLYRCNGCGHVVFPERKLCARCGGAVWERLPCYDAVIEAVTTVHRGPDGGGPVTLACARTRPGVRVIARLEQVIAPGAEVSLHEIADHAIWARQTGG